MYTNKKTVSRHHPIAWVGSAIATLTLAAGCTSTPASKLSSKEQSALEGKSVVLDQKPTTHFLVNASSAVLSVALDPFMAGKFNAEGGAAGDRLVKQDRLTDPATVIGPGLLADLQSQYHMKVIAGPPSNGDARYVLSEEVTVWNAMYLPFRLSHYGVMLVVNADVTDRATKRKLRGAQCIIRPRDQPDAPTLTELLENDGARLRVEVDYASGACLETMKHSLLGE
jgi:hypothetical protein